MEEYSGDVGVLLALDWFLDRCRTAVNVEGDLMAGAGRVFYSVFTPRVRVFSTQDLTVWWYDKIYVRVFNWVDCLTGGER